MEQQTLNDVITASINNALNADAIASQVQKVADKAIAEAIESAFNYSSEFRKNLKAMVERAIPVIETDDLVKFTTAVRDVVTNRLKTLSSETAKVHMDELLANLLPDEPVIQMSELKKLYKDKIARLDDCYCDGEDDYEDSFKWEIERGESKTQVYFDLLIAEDQSESRYGGKCLVLRFNDHDCEPGLYSCWNINDLRNESGVTGSIFRGAVFGFDAAIFRLGTGAAKLAYDGFTK